MTISTYLLERPHDAALMHAARATRILTCDPDGIARATVPDGCDQYDDLLFTASGAMSGGRATVDALAERFACDAIDVSRTTDGSFRYALGVRLYWKMLWHDHEYRLWRPSNGTAACFVPADPGHDVWFSVTDGRLEAQKGDFPWACDQDRILGLRLGAAALGRLTEGR